MPDSLLIPNLGAEEGGDWRELQRLPAVRTVARLWRSLFEAAQPVYAWLGGEGTATAWLNTEEAAREAAAAGRSLSGADPAVVRRVHDKAFAHAAASSEGLVPASLAPLIECFEPAELRDTDTALRRLAACGAGWPAWTGGRFVLKPRCGGSGRGRVAGVFGEETAALGGALPRLAERGGALLEPWLERAGDYSTQLWVGPDGRLVLLGTTTQLVSPAGTPLGNRGSVDSKGRVDCGERFDHKLRDAAVAVALCAAREGFRGPCGVDAFRFRGPHGPELRPVVEFNARFTTGTLALALVRSVLRRLRKKVGLAAGRPVAFAFGLDAPAGGWPEDASGDGLWLVPLWSDADVARPALLFAREGEQLDRFWP